jgi:hypothetical protein
MSITQTVCVFVALGIQHAMRMRHIVTCGLSLSAILFHIVLQIARFQKKEVAEHKLCVAEHNCVLLNTNCVLLNTTVCC